MRKVIGIGETVLDIIFKNNQPDTAAPGGSTFRKQPAWRHHLRFHEREWGQH